MLIKSFKIQKKLIIVLIIVIILLSSITIFYSFATDNAFDNTEIEEKKDFIKWVDFNVTSEVLNLTSKLDIDSHKIGRAHV